MPVMKPIHRKPYPTDVTDKEWEIWERALPFPRYHPNFPEPKYPRREILNAILYRARTGTQWRNLPHDFPPWKDVYYHFSNWKRRNVFSRARDALRREIREQEGRDAEPTLGIVDSQSVRGTEMSADTGYDAGKKVKGRKRHVLVDVLGLLLAVTVTAASLQDRDGLARVGAGMRHQWPTLLAILVDSAYKGNVVDTFASEAGIRVEVTQPPPGQKGFVVVKKRWVVERTFGWLNWERLLSKSYERLADTEEADINVVVCRMMVRRLASIKID